MCERGGLCVAGVFVAICETRGRPTPHRIVSLSEEEARMVGCRRPYRLANVLAVAAAAASAACGKGPLDVASQSSYNTGFIFTFDLS